MTNTPNNAVEAKKEKRCAACGETKPLLTDFSRNKNSKDQHDHYCKACRAQKARARYKDDPELRERMEQNRRERIEKWKKEIQEMDRAKKCEITGATENLDWHHLNPSTKKFNISKAHEHTREDVLNEIEQCVRICDEAHAKLHRALEGKRITNPEPALVSFIYEHYHIVLEPAEVEDEPEFKVVKRGNKAKKKAA